MAYLIAIIGFAPNTVILNTARGLGGYVYVVCITEIWISITSSRSQFLFSPFPSPSGRGLFVFGLNYDKKQHARQIATSMIYGSQVFSNRSFIALSTLTNIPATIV